MSKLTITKVEKPFKISVGNATPKKITFGYPEKGMTTLKSGEAIIEAEYVGGQVIFPNMWKAHGRRVNKDGKPCDVTDPSYLGTIEFMTPDNMEGSLIECRYLSGYGSLDYQYQITRGMQLKKEEEKGNLPFEFEKGVHEINPAKDAMYALALWVHPYNADSQFKKDEYNTSLFSVVNELEVDKLKVESIDLEFNSIKTVKDASDDINKLKLIHRIVSKGGSIPYDNTNENSLYTALVQFAKTDAIEFSKRMTEYEEEVNYLISIGKSNKIFDTTKNGEIYFGDDIKKKLLIDEIPSDYKGENMLQYIFEERLNPKVSKVIDNLRDFVNKKYKK